MSFFGARCAFACLLWSHALTEAHVCMEATSAHGHTLSFWLAHCAVCTACPNRLARCCLTIVLCCGQLGVSQLPHAPQLGQALVLSRLAVAHVPQDAGSMCCVHRNWCIACQHSAE